MKYFPKNVSYTDNLIRWVVCHYVSDTSICGALHDLVQFVQFKERGAVAYELLECV